MEGVCFSLAAIGVVTSICVGLTGAIAALWKRDTGRSDDRLKYLEGKNSELAKENSDLSRKIDRLYAVLLQSKGTSAAALELVRVDGQP